MPTYDYEHTGDGCKLGKRFELVHSMSEPAQETCPECGEPITRIISPVGISTPKGDSELKGMGFAKLVRRDWQAPVEVPHFQRVERFRVEATVDGIDGDVALSSLRFFC